MNANDLLKDVYDKKYAQDRAGEMISEMLSSPDGADTARKFGFSKTEWTAFAHGAELTEVASWRYDGWPDICCICKLPIIVENFGWQVVDDDDVSGLRHVRCPVI
jgi:hypothetical protein